MNIPKHTRVWPALRKIIPDLSKDNAILSLGYNENSKKYCAFFVEDQLKVFFQTIIVMIQAYRMVAHIRCLKYDKSDG